jgi:hypothetical protein
MHCAIPNFLEGKSLGSLSKILYKQTSKFDVLRFPIIIINHLKFENDSCCCLYTASLRLKHFGKIASDFTGNVIGLSQMNQVKIRDFYRSEI